MNSNSIMTVLSDTPVQSDSQTSEWYSYFENDVLVIYPAAKECMNNCTFGERDSIMLLFTHRYREVFWHECAKILRHTSQNSIAAGNLE